MLMKRSIVVFTALIFAAYNGHLEIVKYLIEADANVNEQTNDGFTGLILVLRRDTWKL